MRETFVRSGQGLLYREESGAAEPPRYEREMFLVCHIDGLIEARSGRIDETPYLVYAVGDRLSLADKARGGTLTEGDIKSVRETLGELKESLPAYLLSPDSLCLDPNHIYLDETGAAGFLYLPDREPEAAGRETETVGREPETPGREAAETAVQPSEAISLNAFLADEEDRLRGITSGASSGSVAWSDDAAFSADPGSEAFYTEAAADRQTENVFSDAGAAQPFRENAGPDQPRRFRLIDTFLTTLFLVGVVLAVFAVLQSGILDHVFDMFL